MGRHFGVRKSEHTKDVANFEKAPFTRAASKASQIEQNKSALTDHVALTNHTIDWDNSKSVVREDNRLKRWIREAIHIQMEGQQTINRDQGQYQLPKLYNPIIKTVCTSNGQSH